MISPHTPPGTKVVALKSAGSPWRGEHVIVGHVYTVAKIIEYTPGIPSDGRFGAGLQEVHHGPFYTNGYKTWIYHPLRIFRRLDLPECLTEILDRVPAPDDGGVKIKEPEIV